MAAKKTSTNTVRQFVKAKRKRPGIHAKTKYSKLKKSRNYKKLYVGQG